MDVKNRINNTIDFKGIQLISDFIRRNNQLIINYENQRPYVWTDLEINQLLIDLYDSYSNNNKYYCHSMTITNYDDYKTPSHIVDGQQRFTTITLLLYYLAKKSKNDSNIRRLKNPKYNDEYVFKVGDIDFDKLSFDFTDDEYDDSDDNTPINYKYASKLIDLFYKNQPNNIDYNDLFNWLMDSTYFSIIELLDEKSESAYFYDVNSKGKRISQVDTIKINLISKLGNDKDINIIIDLWSNFDKKIDKLIKKKWKPKTTRDGDLKEIIFKETHRITNPSFKQKDITNEICDSYNNINEISTFIKKSTDYVQNILNYYYSDDIKYKQPTIFFRERKMKSHLFTIMVAKEYGYEINDCLEIYNRLTLFLSTSVKQLFDVKIDELHKTMRNGGDIILWYNNIITRQTIDDISKEMYYQPNSNARIKSAFVFIEANLYKTSNKDYKETVIEKRLFEDFNIEHIYPKHGDKDVSQWFNKLGNLTLLNIGKNSSVKDVMMQKPPAYKDIIKCTLMSRLLLTNDPLDYPSLMVNKNHLNCVTPFTEKEVENWDCNMAEKRKVEIASLFKEMLYMK